MVRNFRYTPGNDHSKFAPETRPEFAPQKEMPLRLPTTSTINFQVWAYFVSGGYPFRKSLCGHLAFRTNDADGARKHQVGLSAP